jgi:DNA segregation ATPase FtsK/SpoIIIE, S-DNA-T family
MPPDWIKDLPGLVTTGAALVLAIAAAVVAVKVTVAVVRYVRADANGRRVLRAAWRIRRTWKRAARRVGLMQIDKSRPPLWSSQPQTELVRRELVPSVKVHTERWGVSVDGSTVGRIGLKEFQDAATHLADIWGLPQVRVEQARPGLIRLHVLLRDPLTEWTRWTDEATTPADPATWLAGVDADGQPVTIRSSGVSGVVVAGLAGYGKTSFLNARFCRLAPSSAVQFVLIDGKGIDADVGGRHLPVRLGIWGSGVTSWDSGRGVDDLRWQNPDPLECRMPKAW